MKTFLRTSSLMVGVIFLFLDSTSWADLSVGNYTLVSSKRVSRTEYEYTYQAQVINNGGAVLNVTAQVESISPFTAIVEGDVSFGDVAAGATVSSADTFTIRHNRLYAFSWGNIAWVIQSEEVQGSADLIGPSGGTVTDPSGASVLVPPGALAEERLISIKSHNNESSLPAPAPFIGGAKFGPDGITFQRPVTIILPLSIELPPGTILSIFQYDVTRQGWLYTSFQAVVNPDMWSASAEVTHFTDYIITMGIDANAGDIGLYFGTFDQKFNDICNPTPTSELIANLVDLWSTQLFPVGNKIPYNFSAFFPDKGYECYEVAGIQFVFEGARAVPDPTDPSGAWIEMEYVPFEDLIGSQTDLQMVFDAMVPTEIHDINCGDQQTVWSWQMVVFFRCSAADIALEAGTTELYTNETTDIKARVTCGREGMKNWPVKFDFAPSSVSGVIIPSQTSTNENGETDNVTLSAACEEGTIDALASQQVCKGTSSEGWYNSPGVPIEVKSRVESIQVNPQADTLSVGEVLVVEAIPLDKEGNEAAIEPNHITWDSSDSSIAWVSPSMGLPTAVTASNIGEVVITAQYDDQCRQISGQAQVTVNCEPCTFQVNPSAIALILGNNATTLQAELLDVNGNIVNILPPSAVTWTSNSSGVSLNPTTGSQTTVTPNDEGPATITATYTDHSGTKTATAIIRVRSFAGEWDTYWGENIYTPMVLAVNGTLGTGSYTYSRFDCGTINGTLNGQLSDDGRYFAGTWVETCDIGSGGFKFHLSADGKSFTGLWNGKLPWNGIRR